MKITKINDYETVENAIEKDEPLMAVISFKGDKAYVSHLDDGVEHHILLNKANEPPTDIDYKNISDKTRRIAEFYKDGFSLISEFLSDFGYFIEIKIPTRYRRHFDELMKQ